MPPPCPCFPSRTVTSDFQQHAANNTNTPKLHGFKQTATICYVSWFWGLPGPSLCWFPLGSCDSSHPKGRLDQKAGGDGLSHIWRLALAVGWVASVVPHPPVGETGL